MDGKKRDLGEVYAPVEDSETPFGLKLLVVLLLLGLVVLLALTITLVNISPLLN